MEPNPNSWARIQEYFQGFALRDQLEAVEAVALEQFETDRRFQVIDAEGFIYTVNQASGPILDGLTEMRGLRWELFDSESSGCR